MKVVKRDGRTEPVAFEKIASRLQTLAALPPRLDHVDIPKIAQHACAAVHDGIKTETLDEVTADAAVALSTEHPEYSRIAARILVSNLQKNTKPGVLETLVNVSSELRDIVETCHEDLDAMVDFSRDYNFDYFGFRTLQKAYLMKGERPQHMYLRVALCIWGSDMERVRETYDALSTHLFTHASPTLFNAGTKTQQLASCFLLGVHTDSLDGIFEAFHKAASISKYGGGIGFHVSSIRSKGSPIKSTDGKSDGLVPMLKVLNEIANYVNQSGKRKGSVAVYIEPHHADIMAVLDLKRNQGDEHLRARDLFYALWISDLFMERVKNQAMWSLFDPGTAPGLEDVWGEAYRELYERYEKEGRAVRQLPAVDVWFAALRLQIETGVPYMLYKDAANAKSNQQNLGTIKCSNLCVAPETLVLTRSGHLRIADMEGETHDVWNGEEWSRVKIKRTNRLSELMRVSLSDGTSLDCTPYHKFYLADGTEAPASKLNVGDRLIPWVAPVLEFQQNEAFPHARMHGFFCGIVDDAGLTAMFPETMPPKYAVPETAPLEDRLEWLGGLVDATVDEEEYACGLLCIEVATCDFLKRVQNMLLTMGVRSIHMGKHLVINRTGVSELVRLGLTTRRVELQATLDGTLPDVYVERVHCTERFDTTYCFDEPKRHMGVFNGILTGNCSEIIEYTAEDEIAVCNLASISLPAFASDGRYDYAKLHRVAKIVTRNLNRIIDVTFYPAEEAEKSNKRHRPIGIGVQGLADVFFKLKVAFDSPEAAEINRRVFATIYHAAVETSVELARLEGPYETFRGSPASLGKLQFDLWNVAPEPMYDWDVLKTRVCAIGMRNSLLVAPMPTASTSQLLGNTEAFEPVTSNLYSRTTLAGTFTVVNKYLLEDLVARGLWSPELKRKLVAAEGSVQPIEEIPDDLKAIYKTAYELSMKTLIDMAADRGAYVDQSMSLNLFVAAPTFRKLSSMHFYAWEKGLKTGQYYLRSRPASGATKITVDAVECLACSG